MPGARGAKSRLCASPTGWPKKRQDGHEPDARGTTFVCRLLLRASLRRRRTNAGKDSSGLLDNSKMDPSARVSCLTGSAASQVGWACEEQAEHDHIARLDAGQAAEPNVEGKLDICTPVSSSSAASALCATDSARNDRVPRSEIRSRSTGCAAPLGTTLFNIIWSLSY